MKGLLKIAIKLICAISITYISIAPTPQYAPLFKRLTQVKNGKVSCMLQIHPNARTMPVTRAEIARSGEPKGLLA